MLSTQGKLTLDEGKQYPRDTVSRSFGEDDHRKIVASLAQRGRRQRKMNSHCDITPAESCAAYSASLAQGPPLVCGCRRHLDGPILNMLNLGVVTNLLAQYGRRWPIDLGSHAKVGRGFVEGHRVR